MEWNRLSLATNPDSISTVMTIVLCGRSRGEHLNPAFCFTATHRSHNWCDGIGCHCLQYTVTPKVLMRHHDTPAGMSMTFCNHMRCPLMQRLPGAIFQQDNARPYTAWGVTRLSQHCYYPSLTCLILQICLQSTISG
ncbi:hypothetical protein TNCV_4682691 [Trichonephila clavipes]|nr:hypothetical protein TNCV_4682691 [Trichonephila clavipes]